LLDSNLIHLQEKARPGRRQLLVSSGILIVSRCIVAAAGFVVVVFIAARFGAGVDTDAYFMARLIPVGIWIVLGYALNLSLIPTYMHTLAQDGKEAAAKLASDFLRLTLLVSLTLAVAYMLFADQIIKVVAPGFSSEAQVLTVTLTQIMAFAMVFLGLYGVIDSILNASHRYILSALGSLWRPIGAIAGVLVLANFWQMRGVAIGILMGTALQFATVVPGMRGKLVLKTISVDLRNPRLKETLKRLVLVLLVVGAGQINNIVDRVFASLAGKAAVSVFGFGQALIIVFPVLVAMPVYKVLYPEMLRLVATSDKEKLKQLFSWNIFLVAFITIPITASLICFSVPATELAFQHGRFSALAIEQTSDVIMYLSLTLCPTISCILATYYFLATSRTKMLLQLMGVSIALNAVMAYGLMCLMGVAGVALSNSLGAMVRLGIILVFLRKAIGGFGGVRLIRPLVKIGAATTLTVMVIYLGARWLATAVKLNGILDHIVAGTGFALAGLVIYVGLNGLFRNEQMLVLITTLKKHVKLRRLVETQVS